MPWKSIYAFVGMEFCVILYFNFFQDFPKVEMLREDILPTIASSGRYQSLLVEISDAIDLLISK